MMMMKMMMSQHHHEQVSSQTTKFKSFLNNNASKELRRSPTKVVNRLKKKNEYDRRKQHHNGRDVTRACGIIGVMTHENKVSAELYEGLLMLQHRGQDSAGMVTSDGSRFKEKKDNGLVKDVFDKRTMNYLDGNIGLGHVRYPTQGGLSATEAQPFFVNSPLGIYLIHNGNLTNTDA